MHNDLMDNNMKYIVVLLITLLLFFAGCSNVNGIEPNPKTLLINEHTVTYDQKLIDSIDKTKWINIFNPPTVKTMYPEREPQYRIVVGENVSYTLWDSGEYYLVAIKKGEKDYWLSLENQEYENAKDKTSKYKEFEVPYPLTIQSVTEKVAKRYNIYSGYKVEKQLELPQVEQQKNCFLDEKECIYVYSTRTVNEALEVKKALQEKVALMNMVISPKFYTVRNVVILYIPHVENEYILDDDLKTAIKSFE